MPGQAHISVLFPYLKVLLKYPLPFLAWNGAKVVGICVLIGFLTLTAGNVQGQLQKKVKFFEGNKQVIKEIYYVDPRKNNEKNGEYLSFYASGSPKAKGCYYNDMADNLWDRFYENGTLKSRFMYKNGLLDGPATIYFETGKVSQSGFYKDNKEDSTWQYFYENGKLKTEGNFVTGKAHGFWRYFHEDGTLKATAILFNGRGHYKEFFANGALRMEGLVNNGVSDSIWNYYHENGTIKAFGLEKNGEREGFWKFFHSNGQLSSEGHFKKNVKHGRWKYFHETGTLSSEGDLENDNKEGVWKFFFPSGALMGEGNFSKGNGDYQEFYPNGKLKMRGKIEGNNYIGNWTFYFEDGGLEGECKYEDGYGQFIGYYENGVIRMKGQMHNGQKVGSWDLLGSDGKLIGHYKTFYDIVQPKAQVTKPLPDSSTLKPRNYVRPEFMSVKRRSRHFIPRVNELRGLIVGSNPFAVALSALPLSFEYYFQDRLGYEVTFMFFRKPFFQNHSEDVQNKRIYTQGSSIDFKQKLYSADAGNGNIYVGQELRFSSYDYKLFEIQTVDSISVGRNFNGESTKIEFSILLGDRFFQYYNKHRSFSLDIYCGIGFGYRFIRVPQEMLIYNEIKTNKLTTPIRLGFNFGYMF